MKIFKSSFIFTLLFTISGISLLADENGPEPLESRGGGGDRNGIVIAEDPDGALVVRGGTSREIVVGTRLLPGDVVKSNEATVIITICDGSLVTVYPDSEVIVTNLGDGFGKIDLIKGELLGDTLNDCRVSIGNFIGTTDISNGVYGVLLSESGDGWTLQVRNLDGTVTFTGDPQLDTSNLQVSIVEPGKPLDIPAGEEMIIRGVYNPDTDVFSLSGGPAVATLSEDLIGQMEGGAEFMSAVDFPGASDQLDELPGQGADDPPGLDEAEDKTEGTPAEDVVIDVPWYDVEIASDKG